MKLSALILALLAASCGGPPEPGASSGVSDARSASAPPVSGAAVRLPVTENDSLNPYKAKSKNNRELGLLLFDTLIALDENFGIKYQLAESVEQDGKNLVIRLRGARFSDGSAVTAEDVTYSIAAAQKSETAGFAAQLSNIRSKNAASASVVTIALKKDDPNFARLLNFPVIKLNSDFRKDADKKELPPIGGGRYVLEKAENGLRLLANGSWRGEKPGIANIELVSTPDQDSLNHQLLSGGIGVYYSDLSDGKFPVMNGAAARVPQNNLVFLGVGLKAGPLTDPAVRSAVSEAVDRNELAAKAYATYALAAVGIFHPLWAAGTPTEILLAGSPKLNLAVADLAKAGYNKKDSDGFYTRAGKRLTLKLLVNGENAQRAAAAGQIRDSLAKCGVEVKVAQLAFAQYSAAISGGDYDLYLGEMRLLNNMDVSPLLPGGTQAAAAWAAYLGGDGTPGAFADLVNTELPVIPLCYRSGILVSLSAFGGSLIPGATDLFYGLESVDLK